MKIARVEILPFLARYRGEGFAVSYGRLTELRHRLVRLTTECGAMGVGEIQRKPASNEDAAEREEDRLMPVLEGRQVADLPAIATALRSQGWRGRALALAFETAFWDLAGRRMGTPLSALLGGPAGGDVPALLGLSCDAPDVVAAQLQDRGAGYASVQVKLGTGTIANDMARVVAALDALHPGQRFYADFNGALPREVALEVLPGIDDPRLIWEEPCATLDDNLACAAALACPVLLDQCVGGPEPLMHVIKVRDSAPGIAGVSVKAFYFGGLGPARQARDICVAAGLPLRIDGPWCGPIGASAAVHLALGTPAELLLFSADLTDPLEPGPRMTSAPAPGRVAPVPGPGLGALPGELFQQASA